MAKRPPAIQTRQGHPQGIVDDVLIPIAKKVIRATSKRSPAKGLARETKMIAKRHNKLVDKRRTTRTEFGRDLVDIKMYKNMRSGGKTARDYRVGTAEAGLPTGAHRIGSRKKAPEIKGSGPRVSRKDLRKAYPTKGAGVDKKVVKQMRKEKAASVKRNYKGR